MKKIMIALSCMAAFSCASVEKVEGLREPAQVANVGTFKTTALPLNAKGIGLASLRYKDKLAKIPNLTNISVLKEIVRESYRIEEEYEALESSIYSSETTMNKDQYEQKSASKAEKLAALNQRALDFLKNAKQCFDGQVNVPASFQLFDTWAIKLQETNLTSTPTPFNKELKKTPSLRAEVIYVGRMTYDML
ncbi:MAG: hypothetical protein H7235_05005 [Bdellovibrionaceae bacterium]|nr:hypothetical protein [Pseudobdellovibrionaceae bacterium]